jgi:hypothetical protein
MRRINTTNLKATATVCAVIVVMSAATTHAQAVDSPDGATQARVFEADRREIVPGLQAGASSIRDWRLTGGFEPLWTPSPAQSPAGHAARLPQQRRPHGRSGSYRDAQRILGAAAMGVVGFLAGGVIGAGLDGNCRCDDPHMRGFVIGAPIGAAVGAVLGAVMIR